MRGHTVYISVLAQHQSETSTLGSNDYNILLAKNLNSTGFRDAYASIFFPTNSTFLNPVKVSSENGYPSTVMNWHGDFLGVSFVSNNKMIMVWSDGRGTSDHYGYGHIYSPTVRTLISHFQGLYIESLTPASASMSASSFVMVPIKSQY